MYTVRWNTFNVIKNVYKHPKIIAFPMLAEILCLQGQAKNFSGMHLHIVIYCLVT